MTDNQKFAAILFRVISLTACIFGAVKLTYEVVLTAVIKNPVTAERTDSVYASCVFITFGIVLAALSQPLGKYLCLSIEKGEK